MDHGGQSSIFIRPDVANSPYVTKIRGESYEELREQVQKGNQLFALYDAIRSQEDIAAEARQIAQMLAEGEPADSIWVTAPIPHIVTRFEQVIDEAAFVLSFVNDWSPSGWVRFYCVPDWLVKESQIAKG